MLFDFNENKYKKYVKYRQSRIMLCSESEVDIFEEEMSLEYGGAKVIDTGKQTSIINSPKKKGKYQKKIDNNKFSGTKKIRHQLYKTSYYRKDDRYG